MEQPTGCRNRFLWLPPKTRRLLPDPFICRKERSTDLESPSPFFQILFGSILGDGCITSYYLSFYHFLEVHAANQKEYLEWKARQFSSFLNVDLKVILSKRKKISTNQQKIYILSIPSHPIFHEWRKKFYKEPKEKEERGKNMDINVKFL